MAFLHFRNRNLFVLLYVILILLPHQISARNPYFFHMDAISPEDEVYIQSLIEKSKNMGLHVNRQWIKLLHYRDQRLYKYYSEADGSAFFWAEDGYKNPKSEMAATIRSFFIRPELAGENDPQIKDELHSLCRFPARFKYIDSYLKIEKNRLPTPYCEKYLNFKNNIRPQSVSIVFATYFSKEPASMWGHTLMKLNVEKEKSNDLLDYGVSYAAYSGGANFIKYMIYGLFGFFPGKFDFLNYHVKMREYNDMESRDTWEYRINLSPEGVERIQDHIWELKNTFFYYTFFSENCSYHLLSLLEVARPELTLTDNFQDWWVIPGETIKELYKYPGLVEKVIYRPSIQSQVKQRVQTMNDEEQDLFFDMIDEDIQLEDKRFLNLSQERQAFIMDAVLSVMRYRREKGLMDEDDKKYYRKMLLARTERPIDANIYNFEKQSGPVENAHNLNMIRTGGGAVSSGAGFGEIVVRPHLNDILNRSEGYVADSEMVFMETAIRKYSNEKDPWIQYLDIFRLQSYSPSDGFSKSTAYNLKVGWSTEYEKLSALNGTQRSYLKRRLWEDYDLIPGMIYSGLLDQDRQIQRTIYDYYYFGDTRESLKSYLPDYPDDDLEPFVSKNLYEDHFRPEYEKYERFHAFNMELQFGKSWGDAYASRYVPIIFYALGGVRIQNSSHFETMNRAGAFATIGTFHNGENYKIQIQGSYLSYSDGVKSYEGILAFSYFPFQNHEFRITLRGRPEESEGSLSYSIFL